MARPIKQADPRLCEVGPSAADARKLGARSETRPGDGLGPLHTSASTTTPRSSLSYSERGRPDRRRGRARRGNSRPYHCVRAASTRLTTILDRHDDKKLANPQDVDVPRCTSAPDPGNEFPDDAQEREI